MDGEPKPHSGGTQRHDWGSVLGDLRRRRLLAILLEQSDPVPDDELVVRLAAREADVSPSDVPADDRREIRLDLHHRCLPKLEATGAIERRSDGIRLAERPDPDLECVPDLREPEHPAWDAITTLLDRPRRQAVVSILAERDRPIDLSELVAELDDDEDALVALHHVDLPRLAAVGLVEYDEEAGRVDPGPRLQTVADR